MLRKTPLKARTSLKAKTWLKAKPYSKKVINGDLEKTCSISVDTKTTQKKQNRRTSPNYVADMDKVFQYYIRLRDVMPGGFGRCISCNKIKPFNHLQAGHFFSRRHFSVRWNEDNCNAECEYDNCWNGEHLLTYKENLIKKIGVQRFQMLEVASRQTRRWSDFEIKTMIKYYGEKVVQLASAKKIPISKDVQRIIKKYQKERL